MSGDNGGCEWWRFSSMRASLRSSDKGHFVTMRWLTQRGVPGRFCLNRRAQRKQRSFSRLSVLSALSCSNSELHSPSPFAFFVYVVLVLFGTTLSKARTDAGQSSVQQRHKRNGKDRTWQRNDRQRNGETNTMWQCMEPTPFQPVRPLFNLFF